MVYVYVGRGPLAAAITVSRESGRRCALLEGFSPSAQRAMGRTTIGPHSASLLFRYCFLCHLAPAPLPVGHDDESVAQQLQLPSLQHGDTCRRPACKEVRRHVKHLLLIEVWVDGWAVCEVWVCASHRVGGGLDLRVGFININDMYNNDVGKGGVRVYEAYEVK